MTLQTILWKDLTVGNFVGQGSFADVYLGTWKGKSVAIKKLLLKNLSDQQMQDFSNETKLMSQCQSERIVRLFGVCYEIGNFAMVMELMEKGSLYQLLADDKTQLPWSIRWRIAIEVGEGLTYLHQKQILHRDLKSPNVLIDGQFHAKISDFGLSKIKIDTGSTSTKSVGTVRWQAPELFNIEKDPVHTKATDVYSYGMVLWEIASRKIPFSKAPNETTVGIWIMSGKKETIPEDCPKEYRTQIQRCWAEARPTADQVVQGLKTAIVVEKPVKSWHYDPAIKASANLQEKTYELVTAPPQEIQKVLGFYNHHPIPGYDVASVKVIHNPSFIRGFELHMKKLQERHQNGAFAPKWSWDNHPEWRKKIFEIFVNLAKPHADADFPAVKLLPFWHGTNPQYLDSIFRAGFANLATTDAGFFGKGLYFAYEAEYAHRVYSKGALLLNWIATYSPYPVIDGDMEKLAGKAVHQNYDAHFVPVVPKDPKNLNEVTYFPCKLNQAHTYTELVVFESAACLPLYLIELQTTMPQALASKQMGSHRAWVAKKPEPKPADLFPTHTKIFETLVKKDFSALEPLLKSEIPTLTNNDYDYLKKNCPSGEWEFLISLMLGRLELVQKLCQQKSDRFRLKFGPAIPSPLFVVAHWGGHVNVAEWLEKNRDLLNVFREDGITALHISANKGHVELTRFFLKANRNLITIDDKERRTALHYACFIGHLELAQILVGLDKTLLKKEATYGRTPFYAAVFAGKLPLVQWLFEQTNDRHFLRQGTIHDTPLLLAASKGHLEVAQWFYTTERQLFKTSEYRPTPSNLSGTNPLHAAAENGHLEMVKWLVSVAPEFLKERDRYQKTPLDLAKEKGKADVVDFLNKFI